MTTTADDKASELLAKFSQACSQGWTQAMSVELVAASSREVTLRMVVGDHHLQPFGLVHGGVFAGLVETACSIGAAFCASDGQLVVGVENQTSFLRPVQRGTLLTHARPLHIGRRSQLWEAEIKDEAERLVASGRLRLMNANP